MSQSVPDFTTVIVVISFLLVLGVVAFIVKKKSGHLKKIIKKENNSIDVVHQMPLNNGFLAYVFKVDEEKFFFVGHKSGRGSLTQIDQPKLKTSNSNSKASEQLSIKNTPVKEKARISKPLQHVNISDLLTAHKKGNENA